MTIDAINPLDAFSRLDIRVGTIVDARPFPQTRKPAYKLIVDFGAPLGRKASSAQVTLRYAPEDLLGMQVLAVVNFPPKRIAGFESEVLVLGVPDSEGAVILVTPSRTVPPGGRLY